VVQYHSFDSECGAEDQGDTHQHQLTPCEEKYSEYIQGELLFPSRVDVSDRNVPSRQRDADLAATIHKLAGIENILEALTLGGGSEPSERKSNVSQSDW
jgi:hypothetical protein